MVECNKRYWFTVIPVFCLVFFWEVIFPDNAKTEIRCKGYDCVFEEYGQDKKLISTSTINIQKCKSFEVHKQPRGIRRGYKYSVLCNLQDGRQALLFKHHIQNFNKAQETVDALYNVIILKDYNLNYTYSNK